MIKQYINTIIFVGLTVLVWVINNFYPGAIIEKISFSLTSITVLYIIFRIVLDKYIIRKTPSVKVRYKLRKASSLIFIFTTLFFLVRIWITDTTALVAAYGFVGAAIAFAIQDFFKNFVGGIVLLIKSHYKVGDRIAIKGTAGDVVDIGLLYTSILEIQGWVSGDQPTGRIVLIPNSSILSDQIYNYTDDHTFLWDEIHVPITYSSNWKKAKELILEMVDKEIKDITDIAVPEIDKLHNKYFLSKANIASNVFVSMTDNWISLYVRYITKTRDRRSIHNTLNQNILEIIEKEKDITIASETMFVTVEKSKTR